MVEIKWIVTGSPDTIPGNQNCFTTTDDSEHASPSFWAERATLITLGLIIAALQVADVLTTQHILALGGCELNPFMVSVFEYPALAWVVKGLFLGWCGISAYFSWAVPKVRRFLVAGFLAITVWYTIVIVNNLQVIGGLVG